MACGTVLGITLMKQLNVRRCKRLRVAKGPVNKNRISHISYTFFVKIMILGNGRLSYIL